LPVYYAATTLHPHYKHYLDALWAVTNNRNVACDGKHYRKDWLTDNHRAFLALWKTYKDSKLMQPCGASSDNEQPSKKPGVAGPTESESMFLKSQLEAGCERTFSELEDTLGTPQLWMKAELITALQCLKSWRRIGLKAPNIGHTVDKLVAIQAYLSNHESFF
jgi:hypothetical protein